MINYDSILSAFDGKPTLLQWLKMVKKALDESILKNVNITQNGEKVVFSFNFEDGTSINTPEVTLPRGVGIVRIETTNSKVVGENTESTIRVELSDGSIKQFKTYAKNGRDGLNGSDGASVENIRAIRDEVGPEYTTTFLEASYSDGRHSEFQVRAKNGEDGGGSSSSNIFYHQIRIHDNSGQKGIIFNVYSTKRTLTFDEALSFIPDNMGLPVWYYANEEKGVVSAFKSSQSISLEGVIYNDVLRTTTLLMGSFNASQEIEDTLIGENL